MNTQVDAGSLYSFREKGGADRACMAIEIVADSVCQLECRNCYKGPRRPADEAAFTPGSFVVKALQQAQACGFKEAVFIGGEPTLHPDLPRFVRHAGDFGLDPILCTNGLKLADRRFLAEIAIENATIVIHAPLPAAAGPVQDQHVHRDGYNRALRQACRHLVAMGHMTVVAQIPLIEAFLPYVEDMYCWCREQGFIPFVEMNRRLDTRTRYNGDLRPDQVRQVFQQLHRLDPQSQALVPPAFGCRCTMSITGVHLKNNGGSYSRVYSCCAQSVCHGDLQNEDLAAILSKTSLQVFRDQDQWIAGPCRECVHYSHCRGGCRGEAFLSFGCPRASCPSCWRIPAETRTDPRAMAPTTCVGCPLEDHPDCSLEPCADSTLERVGCFNR